MPMAMLLHGVELNSAPKEGDLYKELTIHGKTFKLLYGYYESFERESAFNDPMPIYPDFIKTPHYTAEGKPLVTAMQDICQFFNGKNDEDSSCSDCLFFQKEEELFGVCNCSHNRQRIEEGANLKVEHKAPFGIALFKKKNESK